MSWADISTHYGQFHDHWKSDYDNGIYWQNFNTTKEIKPVRDTVSGGTINAMSEK